MKMQLYRWSKLTAEDRERILRRAQIDIDAVMDGARSIVEDVRSRGDAALLELTLKLDGADLSSRGIAVTPAEFDEAEKTDR
jgi:histidinol dehydrogenase